MELDSLIGSGRWKILEILALEPSSPIEISAKLKTSVAYVSQQLKLLEAASIVHKEKTGLSEKNKPRNVYHVSKEFLSLTVLAKGNPKRKTIFLNDEQRIITNIWLVDDEKLHSALQKIYWAVSEDINEIKGLFLDNSKYKKTFYIVSDSKKVSSKISSHSKYYSFLLDVHIESSSSKKDFSAFYPIYDPLYLSKGKNLKGGNQ